MEKLYNLLRIIIFTCIFVSLKYLYNMMFINNVLVFKFIEMIMFFILSFSFAFLSDYKKNIFREKIEINFYCALIFTAGCFVLSVIKSVFHTNQVLVIVLNFIEFVFLGGLPLIRDYFFYTKIQDREYILDYAYIIAFFALKLVFNLLLTLIHNLELSERINMVFVLIFPLMIFLMRPMIFSILIRGFVDYDGNEYPVFNRFKVGKSRDSDIVIDEDNPEKSTIFTITAKDKWIIVPSVELNVENRGITSKYDIEDAQTIKYKNNYFTVSHNRGNIVKRFFLVFLFFIPVFLLNAERNDFSFSKKNDITVENIDYLNYPLVNVYMNINNGMDNGGSYDPEKFLVIDSDRTGIIKKIAANDSPVDVVFILDVTGSMFDTFYLFKDNFRKFINNIRNKRRTVRSGVITFMDNIADIKVYGLTENTESLFGQLNRISPDIKEFNSDFNDNPYDAIFKLSEMKFDRDSQKIVILITASPPHVKGDKADHGRDFTSKTTEDVRQYLNSSSYLFYVVSYERYAEYKTIINSNPYKIYDLEFDDFSGILQKLENVIKNQIKLTYLSSQSKDFFEKGVVSKIQVYKDEDAVKAKKIFNALSIRKTAFFESVFGSF
jgi:hypothetical protein